MNESLVVKIVGGSLIASTGIPLEEALVSEVPIEARGRRFVVLVRELPRAGIDWDRCVRAEGPRSVSCATHGWTGVPMDWRAGPCPARAEQIAEQVRAEDR